MKNTNQVVKPLITEVLSQVAQDYKIPESKIISRKRNFELVDVRCIVVKVLDNLNYPKTSIRELINRTDATTIRNLLQRLEDRPDLKLASEKYTQYFLARLK